MYPLPQRPWSSPEVGFPAASHSVQSFSSVISSVQSKNHTFPPAPYGPKPHLRGPGKNITPSHRHLLCEVARIQRIALMLYPFPQRPWSSPAVGFPAASHSVQSFSLSVQSSVQFSLKTGPFHRLPMARIHTSEARGRTLRLRTDTFFAKWRAFSGSRWCCIRSHSALGLHQKWGSQRRPIQFNLSVQSFQFSSV